MKLHELLTKFCDWSSRLKLKSRRVNHNHEFWAAEAIKCQKSKAYFYNTYVRPSGGREITDEEIAELQGESMTPLKLRGYESAYV